MFFGDGEHVLPAQELSHFLGKHKMAGVKPLLSVQVFLTISYENTQTTVVSIENGVNPTGRPRGGSVTKNPKKHSARRASERP